MTDDAGHLVSSTPESEWDEVEQGLMLGLAEYEAGLCGRCGSPVTETTDPARDGDNPDALVVYHVPDPVVCFLCEAMSRKQKSIEDRKDLGVHPTSFHYQAQAVPRKPRRRRRRR